MLASPATAWSYDAAGNATQMGSMLLDRNNAGRLATVRTPSAATLLSPAGFSTVASYTYTANGQRASKVVGNATTWFIRDQAGELIEEANSLGAPQRDYVNVEGELLSLVDPPTCTLALTCALSSSPERVYYVHADHLSTPQAVTSSSGGIVWSADYQPFGTAAATVSTITMNLRLPGQYLDSETGLFQNWYRDYDAKSGRYDSFDPLGLSAGSNGYVYSFSAPLLFTDPTGLWVWGDPIAQELVNAATGFGDGVSSVLTLGLLSTSRVRSIFDIDGGVQQCSASYRGSRYAGYAWGAGTLWTAGLNGGANSVFWAGRGASSVAEAMGTTIAKTPIGSVLARIDATGIITVDRSIWTAASATFAANASGEARAVLAFVSPTSIWNIESAILAFRGIPITVVVP
jgi:RHS repeat-associated protein